MSSHDPFTHPVNVRTLPRRGRDEAYEPDEATRAAIARQLDVTAVRSAKFTAQIAPWKRDGIRVEGRIEADLEQACSVSLEPIDTRIDEPFAMLLVPEGSKLAAPPPEPGQGENELVLNAYGEDPPETFSGDTIDLAEIWLEFLTLAVDPFARAPDAKLPVESQDARPSPFAALSALKPANDA